MLYPLDTDISQGRRPLVLILKDRNITAHELYTERSDTATDVNFQTLVGRSGVAMVTYLKVIALIVVHRIHDARSEAQCHQCVCSKLHRCERHKEGSCVASGGRKLKYDRGFSTNLAGEAVTLSFHPEVAQK